ncbi:MAG: hypothetical protein HZC26_01720 [Candidatus Magasanikbacteria bacterium]|nr:hypothetical protein [Candidatus Magasanikbacteria bacterium]
MLRESEFVKIRVTVPSGEAAEKVRQALGSAGAGAQGNYENCSLSYPVIGRFKPLAGANPAIGSVSKQEEVEEEMIEMLCHKDKVKEVIAALKKAHPYEEPAIDIIPRLEI